MPVNGLDHVNIRTNDPARSAQFYVDIFDLDYRRSPLVSGNQSHWLFDRSGNSIIHFRLRASDGASTGPIDHVALACTGKAEIFARLRARGIAFSVVEGVLPGVTQAFLTDPHGVKLELNFAGA